MRNLLFPLSFLLYLILLIGCTTAPLESKQPTDTIPVRVEKVKKDTFIETIVLSGVTKAKQEFPLLTNTPMLVEEVYTKLGQKVKQGDQLIRLANPELDAQINVVKEQLNLLEQALSKLEPTNTDSQADRQLLTRQYTETLEKADAFVKGAQTGAVTMLDLLQASTELLLIQNQMQALTPLDLANGQREQVVMQQYHAKQQLLALEQAQEQLQIKAPFDGTITMLNISANEVAMPHTPLLHVANTEQILVHLHINSTQINRLSEGTLAHLWFEGQNEALTAPVQSISMGSSIAGNASAEILLENSNQQLAPGQFVKAEVETKRMDNALLVPINAVTFMQDKAFVYTVTDNKARRQPITVGSRNNQDYHVLAGIAEDDLVIVQGQERVMDGSNVYIQK